MDLTGAKPGDELTLLRGGRSESRVTVTRVGRKWLYVSRSSPAHEESEPFSRENGHGKYDAGYRSRLLTFEAYAESQARERLLKELRLAGLELGSDLRKRISTEKLSALYDIVMSVA